MFNESSLENLIIELFKNKDYVYINGDDLEKNDEEVLLIQDLKDYLYKRYKNDNITDEEVNSVILSLKAVSNSDIYTANKIVFNRMVEGE